MNSTIDTRAIDAAEDATELDAARDELVAARARAVNRGADPRAIARVQQLIDEIDGCVSDLMRPFRRH